MTATVAQARDDIGTTFKLAWEADAETVSIPVKWPDTAQGEFPRKTQDANGNPTPWARFTALHNPGIGGQAALAGADSTRRYERFGQVTIALFAPSGDGMSAADEMIRVAMGAFQGVRTTNGVVFSNVRPQEIGPDGAYTHVNILADFEYSEII